MLSLVDLLARGCCLTNRSQPALNKPRTTPAPKRQQNKKPGATGHLRPVPPANLGQASWTPYSTPTLYIAKRRGVELEAQSRANAGPRGPVRQLARCKLRVVCAAFSSRDRVDHLKLCCRRSRVEELAAPLCNGLVGDRLRKSGRLSLHCLGSLLPLAEKDGAAFFAAAAAVVCTAGVVAHPTPPACEPETWAL